MAKITSDLINLDIEKLCQERSVQELQEVVKALDFEIENRRSDLRKIVGDKYKDILTASEVINIMKVTSRQVVDSIDKIIYNCEELLEKKPLENHKLHRKLESKTIEERAVLVQIMLLMVLKNQIWLSLENGNCNLAAQLYLLAQHIHTGLKLLKEDVIQRLPIVKSLKSDINVIRDRIFKRIKEKCQSIKINSEEASSFLVAMILLENQDITQLLSNFLEFRKSALKTLINSSYDTTRTQVIAMMQCLLATVLIVFDNFLETEKGPGLLQKNLEEIILDSSPYTISKVELPQTCLIEFTPDIVKHFRPKVIKLNKMGFPIETVQKTIKSWIEETRKLVQNGLEKQLKLLVNIKSLHFIREEILKDSLPHNWKDVCLEMNLSENFNIWSYYFEGLITTRAEELVTKNICKLIDELRDQAIKLFKENDCIKSSLNIWEENDDFSSNILDNTNNITLFMKMKGYNMGIMDLCRKFDFKFSEINNEVNMYLYKDTEKKEQNQLSLGKEIVDRKRMERHVKKECERNLERFINFMRDNLKLTDDTDSKRLLLASRLSQAIVNLCPHLRNCCTIDNNDNLWNSVCDKFNQNSLEHLQLWVDIATHQNKVTIHLLLDVSNVYSMLSVLPKWETIEIEDKSDEMVVKSQINVPSRPSIALENIFNQIAETLNLLLPYTLPKEVHILYLEKNLLTILECYERLALEDLNQIQALQFLFDVKYLTTFSVPKENADLHHLSQQICDKLRSKVDPFDLDVLYKPLQNNVKYSVLQTQVIFGCLLPSAVHLANIGSSEKREQENEPSIITFSVPSGTTWFPLLPVTAPAQKVLAPTGTQIHKQKNVPKPNKIDNKKSSSSGDVAGMVRSGTAALFGAMANEWFS